MAGRERLERHRAVAARLARLDDRRLAALLDTATPAGVGIGGTTASLEVDGVRVFVKKVPLTDLERRPQHVRSTANLFGLPTFYQYGVGSAGFGAWRELAAHLMTTGWVQAGGCAAFPLLHHWRVLPRPPVPVDLAELERTVAYWEGSAAVRARLAALARSTASVVLFLEHVPHTVRAWLGAAAGGAGAAAAYSFVERELRAGVAAMGARGLLHLDAHLDNLLTDGHRLYFADLGLAMSARFHLSPAEAAFFQRHRSYDRCYTATHLARSLVSTLCGTTPAQCDEVLRDCAATGRPPGGLPEPAAAIVARHAPVAVVMTRFIRQLQTVSKETPYPVEEVLRAAGGVDVSAT
ncbi:MAG TPA: serine/threonine protein phosphatase [Micromonosporaceae bacterium]|nr:serine/threonine protein phosphatase [Micromonosporaceae bacterium]